MKSTLNILVLTFLSILSVTSCKDGTAAEKIEPGPVVTESKDVMLGVMQKHLEAVSNRDLESLKTTLSPKGNMQLILTGMEVIEKVEGFVEHQKEWFTDPNWTFETKILNSEMGDSIAMVIVEANYKEPERDGVPYFNRMIISYVLQKIEGHWYIIKDHASSVEKSTD